MSVLVGQHAILLSLDPMFEEAKTRGLWFFHESSEAGEVWCSPELLRLKHSKGEYVWAPEHWELRSPRGYMKTLKAQAEGMVAEFNELAKRVGDDRSLRLSEVASAAETKTTD